MEDFTIREIEEKDNKDIAGIIRTGLAEHGLDVPGTVYFDPFLDELSSYYKDHPDRRKYNVLIDEGGKVIGGSGVAEFSEGCCELQKLYIHKDYRGKGLGRRLMMRAEEDAKTLGYQQVYLETHTNLADAMRLYERNGYRLIEKPAEVSHSTMNRFYIKDIR